MEAIGCSAIVAGSRAGCYCQLVQLLTSFIRRRAKQRVSGKSRHGSGGLGLAPVVCRVVVEDVQI